MIMLLGTSYSIITNDVVTDESYGFNVANFDTQFMDDTKISLRGIPTDNEDGFKNSKEYTFSITNNSDFDVNYRLDIIENGIFNMADVIRYTYKLNDDDYVDFKLLKDNSTINQNRTLKVGDKDTYHLKLWLSIDADETYMNKNFTASITLFATPDANKYATTLIEYLANNNQDGVRKVNDDYRYIDKNSSNYIWFNCSNHHTKGEDYCEKWRIIGSFDHYENQKKMYKSLKITRNEVVEELPFNNKELNEKYNNSYINTYANGYYYDLLSDDTKKLIYKTLYNIGDTIGNNFSSSINDEKNFTFNTNVGLLNVSDYLYLGSDNWLITSPNIMTINKFQDKVNVINNGISKEENNITYSFVPVVYLRSDVSILSGMGTEQNPYEIGIKYPLNLYTTQ